MTGTCSVTGCDEQRATYMRKGVPVQRDVCTTHYRERCRTAWERRRQPRKITCPHCGHEIEEAR